MIMNMVSGGGGGGSAGLNFSIVGGASQPSNPAENTIWINTSEAITGWVFSASEPDVVYPGFVWVTIGTESNAEFNALKNNGIMIYPVSAKQYVGGAWVDKTAKSFNGTEWVDWWIPGTLFANGNDDTTLTGGWGSFAYSAGSGYSAKTVDVEVSSDGVCAILAGTGYLSTFIGTNNMVDVTDYSTLKMEFSQATRSTQNGAIKACLYSDAGYTTAASSEVIPISGEVNLSPEIDVSGMTGKYYIGYFMWTWNDCTLSAKMKLARLS